MTGVGVAAGYDVCRWLAQGVANALVIGVVKDGSIPPLDYEAGMTQPQDIDRYHPPLKRHFSSLVVARTPTCRGTKQSRWGGGKQEPRNCFGELARHHRHRVATLHFETSLSIMSFFRYHSLCYGSFDYITHYNCM